MRVNFDRFRGNFDHMKDRIRPRTFFPTTLPKKEYDNHSIGELKNGIIHPPNNNRLIQVDPLVDDIGISAMEKECR